MRRMLLALALLHLYREANAVRGALVLKKSHQQSMDSDDNVEEIEELEEEEEEFQKSDVNKASIYEQGETRDFLQFLRKIKYDHRQCPDDGNDGPVIVNVSIVVSNVRSVSEVTMDYSIEMFYREAWRDPRLKYSKAKFKNKTEISLHESYSNFPLASGHLRAECDCVKESAKAEHHASVAAAITERRQHSLQSASFSSSYLWNGPHPFSVRLTAVQAWY